MLQELGVVLVMDDEIGESSTTNDMKPIRRGVKDLVNPLQDSSNVKRGGHSTPVKSNVERTALLHVNIESECELQRTYTKRRHCTQSSNFEISLFLFEIDRDVRPLTIVLVLVDCTLLHMLFS